MATAAVAITEERTSLALELPDGLSFDEWVKVGRRLCASSQVINWHIGDWWNFGIDHYGAEWTEARAKEIWGVQAESARWYGLVAKRFAPVRRLTSLSFTHHQEAAALSAEEADELLDKAEREGLSTRELRAEVNRRRQPPQSYRPPDNPVQAQIDRLVDAWNAADLPARKLFAQLVAESDTTEIERRDYAVDDEPLPIDALSDPEKLALVTGGPVRVCKLLFAVAENDPGVVQLIRSEQKDDETNRLRRAVIMVAKLHTQASLSDIGRVVARDHSVVLRSLEKAKSLWASDQEFRDLCGKLTCSAL